MTADDHVYRRMFSRDQHETASYPVTFGDRRPDVDYVVSPDVELAVNVSLATGRPLLVLGTPGSGKTSLGFAVARRLGWDVYGFVVTSRTRAQDFLWTFDNVRRLSHALATSASTGAESPSRPPADDELYLRPGVLWWALDPARAAEILVAQGKAAPTSFSPGAVVVIDEIDKADPGVPNDLLRPLGDLTFEAIDLVNEVVSRQRDRPPLVVITSNGERTLPSAFIRRCVVLELPRFERDRLLNVAAAHFPNIDSGLHERVLNALIQTSHRDSNGVPEVGTAEYLDVLLASAELGIEPGERGWIEVAAMALLKQSAREA
jgi:MoxR-like ATPase